jgi:hypothetical protein
MISRKQERWPVCRDQSLAARGQGKQQERERGALCRNTGIPTTIKERTTAWRSIQNVTGCKRVEPPILDLLCLLHGAVPQSSGCSRSRAEASGLGRSIQERPREPLALLIVGLGSESIVRVRTRAALHGVMHLPTFRKETIAILHPHFALSQYQMPSIYGRELYDSYHSIDLNLTHLCSIYRCVSTPKMHVACQCPLYPRRHSCIALCECYTGKIDGIQTHSWSENANPHG